MSDAISITSLSKRYSGSNTLALDNLDLQIRSGEVFGFLGSNGAGKSTTIRLLMDFIRPTAGKVTILGYDTVRNSVELKKHVGYLAGDMALYPKMTGKQYLDYMNDLQPASSKAYMNSLIKRLQAETDKNLGELSRGNRQKIGIIQAIMHQPKVLILDEPTSGLDPLMQEEFYSLVREVKQNGTTIFMSSHILGEVQKICDRVGIIRAGKLVTVRDITQMIHEAAQTFDITFAGKIPLAKLKKINGLHIIQNTEKSVSIHMRGKLAPLFEELARHTVTHLSAESLDLEDEFMKLYQEDNAS